MKFFKQLLYFLNILCISTIFFALTYSSVDPSDDDLSDLAIDASNLPDFNNDNEVPAIIINNTNSNVTSNVTEDSSLLTLKIPVINQDFVLTQAVDGHGDPCFAAQLGTVSQPLGQIVGPIEFISLSVLLTHDNKLAIRGKASLWGQDVVVTVQPGKKKDLKSEKPPANKSTISKSSKAEKTVEIYEIDLILSFGNNFALNIVDGHSLAIKSVTLSLDGKNKLKPFSISAKTDFFGQNVILTYDKSKVDSSTYSINLTSMNLSDLSAQIPSPLSQVNLKNVIFNFTKNNKTANSLPNSVLNFSGDIDFTPILSTSNDSSLTVLSNGPVAFDATYNVLNGYDLKVSLTDINIPIVGNLNNGLLEFNKTKLKASESGTESAKDNYSLKLTGDIVFQAANLNLKLNSEYDSKNGFVLSGTVSSSDKPINIAGMSLPLSEMSFDIKRKLIEDKKGWVFLLNTIINLKKFTGFDFSTNAQIEFNSGKFGKFTTQEIIKSISPFASINIPGIENTTLENSTIDVDIEQKGYKISINTDIKDIFGLNLNNAKIFIEKMAGKITTNIPLSGAKDLTLKSIVSELPDFLNVISLNNCAVNILDISGKNTVSITCDTDFTIPNIGQKINLQMDLNAYKKNGKAMFDIKGTVKDTISVSSGISIYNISFSYHRDTKELIFVGDLDLSALGIDTSNKAKMVVKDGIMNFSYDSTIASLNYDGFGVNDISIKYDNGFILSGQAEIFGQNIPGKIELIESFDIASKSKATKSESSGSSLKPIVLVNMPLDGQLSKISGLSWIDKIIKNATFILASQDYQDENISVTKGLNISGEIDFSGKLSSVGKLLKLKDLIVNASIPFNLKGFVLNIVIDSGSNIDTSKVIQFGDVVLQLSESGTGELAIGLALTLYFSPSNNPNNPVPFTGNLTFVTDPIPSIQGEFVMGKTWINPFGLKTIAVGPAGAFIGIEPETVPPLPTSFGILGNMTIGNMLGSIEVIMDLNNILFGCGFKVNLQDMDITDFINSIGGMVGLKFSQLPSGIGGFKKLYMSYGPPGGLEFKDTQSNSSAKNAIASKYFNGNTSFTGLNAMSGSILSGVYFNADWDVIPAILQTDICMVLNPLKPMDGLVAMASIQLSDWLKNDLGSIIKLTDYEDGTFEKFAQANGVDINSIHEKLKNLPCTSNLLNGPRVILVINPTLRLFKIAGGVDLFDGIISGDIFAEFVENNSNSAIPTLDFMIKATIAELLDFQIRMMEANKCLSLEATCITGNEKLAEWSKDSIDELEQALKTAANSMDVASEDISKAQDAIKSIFTDAQSAVDEMKSVELDLQNAISAVNSTLSDADQAALNALNSINSAVGYCQNQVANLESDLSSPSITDVLELKPAAWALELAVFEIAQETLSGIESEAKNIVNGALKTSKITVDGVLAAATDVLSEINKTIDVLLNVIKNLAVAQLEAAKAVTQAAGDVMNDLVQPLLNVLEDAINELLLNILDIKEISFKMPDVSNGNIEYIMKANLFEQDIDLDLKFNITELKSVFEDLGEKIKSGIMDAVNDLVTELW